MPRYTLPAKDLCLDDGWDVIVAGGGPAGCAAATSAARQGARTLLLEASGVLGGMGTSGLVPWFCGYSDGEKILARGLAERVRLGLAEGMPHLKKAFEATPLYAPSIAPEVLKRIYDEMVLGAGARVLFHTQVCSVDCGGGAVGAIIAASKSGLTAFKAKVYVDCTGDGDLAAWAGAPFEKGGPNGELQPATMCFAIANIDEYGLASGPRVHYYDPDSPIWKAIRSDKYPDIIEPHACNRQIGPGVWGFNTGHVFDVDNTDPASTTQALIHGRRMAAQYRDAFAEFHPAFANSYLAATGSMLGVRETRRIVGDYVLVADDYHARRSFADEICRNAYNIDIHSSKEANIAAAKMSIEELKANNARAICSYGPGESFGVPYRCLTPKGLRNVLVAGRCISTDRRLNGSVRIMACCLTTGEAAGCAAAMAAATTSDVHAVDTAALRQTLKRHGAWLP